MGKNVMIRRVHTVGSHMQLVDSLVCLEFLTGRMHESNMASCISYTCLPAFFCICIHTWRFDISPLLFALEKGKKRGEENISRLMVGSNDADEVPGLSCTVPHRTEPHRTARRQTNKVIMTRQQIMVQQGNQFFGEMVVLPSHRNQK